MLAISGKIVLKSDIYQQNYKNTLTAFFLALPFLNASPRPTAFMARLNRVRCARAGEAMRLHRSMHMSHQLTAKKGSFEIPPLNWKAPDTNKQSDRRDSAVADSEPSKKAEASREEA
ncbi:hypothetical protein [Achromobacter sp.]|uniref:hypothetical protein n=1 Tax=Achromobacter sp. TaxID=134375 RepID=UPI0028AC846E|nr:hypothetical protein [Achromobacter sp.]